MKIIWQPGDIHGGRIVGKPDRGERWMIVYMPSERDDIGIAYALVCLDDGVIEGAFTSAEALAARLNESGDLPIEFFSDPTHVKRGQKGAAARAAALSPARRSEIASRAARARWGNRA